MYIFPNFWRCGTGLSSIFWVNDAKEVVGIDPNEEMLQTAKKSYSTTTNLSFQQGFSNATGRLII
jgi:ubiquinone/menaquinone biosynthesis C-methylase UbiE